MNKRHFQRAEAGPAGRMTMLAAAVGLCVFVTVLAGVTLTLRASMREQIVARDAAVLNSLALFEVERAGESLKRIYGATYRDEDLILEILLGVSRLEGVVALRVFDSDGSFVDAAPTAFVRGSIAPEDMETLQGLQPVSHYLENVPLERYFHGEATGEASILEVLVPIRDSSTQSLLGVAQFLLDGSAIKAAFIKLDKSLAMQAGAALLTALILGGGLVGWSFYGLHRGYRLLLARTRELAKANRELALRSRVSAIGAVTANLIHGLRNPLAALSAFVEERRNNAPGDEGLEEAKEAAARMGRMVEESLSILGQEEGGERFDYSLAEIADVTRDRCEAEAGSKNVSLIIQGNGELLLDNRLGNLLTLALTNLMLNAVQAVGEGGRVSLTWTIEGTRTIFRIEDDGPGLPPHIAQDPFRATRSSKHRGMGVGLAIAYQLVSQMGGKLELAKSDALGTCFRISIDAR